MTVVRAADPVTFETHGSTFHSYVSPSRGSAELCAWRVEVPAGLRGTAHRPTREEVLLVLEGELQVSIDGEVTVLARGDVAVVPAGSELRVDGGPPGAVVWVSTTPGLEAVMADGSRLEPPWAR